MNQGDMNSLCIDELSPISFSSLNVNSFVLSPNLLLHANDSVKSDDLDLSLFAGSSDDNSLLDISPPGLKSNQCPTHVVKGAWNAAEQYGTHAVSLFGGGQNHPQHQSTSYCEKKTAVCTTQWKNTCTSRGPSLEGRQLIHNVLPSSPLHEALDFASNDVAHYITVRNSSLHETFRCSVENQPVLACASLQNSLLQEDSHLHDEKRQGLGCRQLGASVPFICGTFDNCGAETYLGDGRSQVTNGQVTVSSLCTAHNTACHHSWEKTLALRKSDSGPECCTESYDSCKPKIKESVEELRDFCRPQKNRVAETNTEPSHCHRPQNKENVSETDIGPINSFISKNNIADSKAGCIVKSADRQTVAESDAELNDVFTSGNKENIEESVSELSNSHRPKEKETTTEPKPVNSCPPGRKDMCQARQCSDSVARSTHSVRNKRFQKRKKLVRQKRIISESDSDSSEYLKRNHKKYKATSDSSENCSIDSKSPLPLRRSQRISGRFTLNFVDSESDSPGMSVKDQKRRKIRLSSSCSEYENPGPPRKSKRVTKKKIYSEYTQLSDSCEDDDRRKNGCVSENHCVDNHGKDPCCNRRESKRVEATTALKTMVGSNQPTFREFVPVAQVVFHNHSAETEKQSTSSDAQKNTHPTAEREMVCDKKEENSSTMKIKSPTHQVKQSTLSELKHLETRGEHGNCQKQASFQEGENGSVSDVPLKNADILEISGQMQTEFEASENRLSNNCNRTHQIESLKSQDEDGRKGESPPGHLQQQTKLNESASQVSSEIKDTDRQASSSLETVTIDSTFEHGNGQSIHKRISKSISSHLTSRRKKDSESKSISKLNQANSACATSLKKKVSTTVQDSPKGKPVPKAQFVFKVKLKEPVIPFYKQKLRKNGSSHIPNGTDQKENCSEFDSFVSKTDKKDYKRSVSKSKKATGASPHFKLKHQEPVTGTKIQREVLFQDKRNLQEKERNLKNQPEEGADSATLDTIQPHVYHSKSKQILPNVEAHECPVKNSVLTKTLKTKEDCRGGTDNPLKAAVADSDQTPNDHSLLQQSTSKISDRDCQKSEKDRDWKENHVRRRKSTKGKPHHNRTRGGGGKVYNFLTLAKAIGTEMDAIQFCQQYGLLPQSSHCPICGTLLSKLYKIVRTVKTSSVEFRFQCNRKYCKSRGQIPVRSAHWFSKSTNIQFCQHLLIFYLFSNQFTTEQAVEESEISGESIQVGRKLGSNKSGKTVCTETVQELYSFCREVCVLSLPKPEPIGGTVVILEAQFGKTQHCTARFPQGQFVLGAFCRQTDVVFFIPVPALESQHVIPVIEKYVKKGSEVQTDNSPIYRKLGTLGYKHVVLNHSNHELDSRTGRCSKHNKDSIWWVRKGSVSSAKKASSASSDTKKASSSSNAKASSVDTKKASSLSMDSKKASSSSMNKKKASSLSMNKKKASSLSMDSKKASVSSINKKASSLSMDCKKALSINKKKASSLLMDSKKASSSMNTKKASSSVNIKKASLSPMEIKKVSSIIEDLRRTSSSTIQDISMTFSTSTTNDMQRANSRLSSFVSECVSEYNSQMSQVTTYVHGSAKRKRKVSTPSIDSADIVDTDHPSGCSDIVDTDHPSGCSDISGESVALGEAQTCSIPQTSGHKSSTPPLQKELSKTFSTCGLDASDGREDILPSDNAGLCSSGSSDVLLDADRALNSEENWIFALHMAEFLWRRIHRDDQDVFLSFLRAMMEVFPLEEQ